MDSTPSRIALSGPNVCDRSTLLNLVVGHMSPKRALARVSVKALGLATYYRIRSAWTGVRLAAMYLCDRSLTVELDNYSAGRM